MAARVVSAGDALFAAMASADSMVVQQPDSMVRVATDSVQCPPETVERCSLLAARGDVQELRPLYAQWHASLPADVALYCRFAFARVEGENALTSAIVDTLESQYADHFDLRGLLALCDIKCEALRKMGAYADLSRYCKSRLDWCFRRGIKASRRENLKFYQQLAQRFSDAPATVVEWTEPQALVPISREWPTMVPVSVTGGDGAETAGALPFLFADHQLFTVISEADARECDITPVGEPLKITTEHGKTTARPAMARRLQMGNLVLHDVIVFVASDELQAPYNRSVGRDVLRRFRQRLEGDDYLKLSAEGPYLRENQSIRTDTLHTVRGVNDYIAERDILGLLRNETSLQLTASEAELKAMDEAIDQYFVGWTDAASYPAWLEAIVTQETPSDRQAYRLYNTVDGYVYEFPEDGRFRTVILNSDNTKGCLVNLQNMMIYVP